MISALIAWHLHGLRSGSIAVWVDAALIAALMALGPGALVLFTRRSRLVVVDGDGIHVERAAVIPWSKVQRVAWNRSAFSLKESEPDELEEDMAIDAVQACITAPGCTFGMFLVMMQSLLFEIVYLRTFVVLSPWCPRVVVEVEDGAPLSLRDLDNPAAFIRVVRRVLRFRDS